MDGYHDIIFDAMDRMEGAELRPTANIYNAIIYAFSRSGDAAAAEFYFWEMKRKGNTLFRSSPQPEPSRVTDTAHSLLLPTAAT